VAANKLGRRIDDNVGSPLDGTNQRRGGGSVVDHERHFMIVGDAGQGLDFRHVEFRIASVSV